MKKEEKGGEERRGGEVWGGLSHVPNNICLSTGIPWGKGPPQGICLWFEGLCILLAFQDFPAGLGESPSSCSLFQKGTLLWEATESPRMPHPGFLAKLQAPPPGCFA